MYVLEENMACKMLSYLKYLKITSKKQPQGKNLMCSVQYRQEKRKGKYFPQEIIFYYFFSGMSKWKLMSKPIPDYFSH